MIVEIGGSRRVVDRRFLIDEYDQGKFPNSRHSGRVVLGSTAGITIALEEFRSHSQPGTAARLRSGLPLCRRSGIKIELDGGWGGNLHRLGLYTGSFIGVLSV